jgi:hypothetical protein
MQHSAIHPVHGLVLLLCILCLTACYEFELIDQPITASANSSFEVPIEISFIDIEGEGWPEFAILLPEGWQVTDWIPFTGIIEGFLVYSDSISTEVNSGEHPEGYQWWCGQAVQTHSIDSDGNMMFTLEIQTDASVGFFTLDYQFGHDGVDFIFSHHHPISIDMPTSAVVTSTANVGTGSLRDAIATVGCGADITFDLPSQSTIALSQVLSVDRPLNIHGPPGADLSISGSGVTRIMEIFPNCDMVLSDLILEQGHGEGNIGGAITTYTGRLELTDVVIRNNQASSGAGIYSEGTSLILTRVIIENNAADWEGGGVWATLGEEMIFDQVNIINNTCSDGSEGYGAGVMLYNGGG